uniref:Glycosyltransferase n=1 Tax=Polygala tenuifolia TaxID=355332 RepID=A0A4V0P8C6_9FABA|nr:UDP-glycosyltransferase [Polygala tenuifolia]
MRNPLKGCFIPHLALSHTFPMANIAKLFANRGVDATIVTIPYYYETLQKSIEQHVASGSKIKLQIMDFPLKEFGLPEEVDIQELGTSFELQGKIFTTFYRLQHVFEKVLRDQQPDFVVADMHCSWATDVSAELGVPRLVYHGRSYLALCAEYVLTQQFDAHKNIATEDELFEVPNLPGKILMKRSEIPDFNGMPKGFINILNKIEESAQKSYGTLVESFDELEPEYADYYRNGMGRKAWSIGPIQLFNKEISGGSHQPDEGKQEHPCLSWLDSRSSHSVVYVSFGSLTNFSLTQQLEIAQALESSGHPFIWVLRKNTVQEKSKEDDLMEEFERRVAESNIGFVIRGWAPQTLILNHPAIGGFLTHCGWNSVIESIIAGVPMITWPISADHFYDEKLVIQVLGIGVEIGVERITHLIMESTALVSSAKIAEGVKKLMGDKEQADKMRERIQRLAGSAKAAVEKGGSSYNQLDSLVEDLVQISQSNKPALAV